jgi:hypothetical protein
MAARPLRGRLPSFAARACVIKSTCHPTFSASIRGGVGNAFRCTTWIAPMLWFYLLLAVVLVAAAASLVASGNTRRDLATGRPTFDSVADATGIWNRSRLDELVGPRDGDDRYAVSAELVRNIPPTWWKRWFDSDVADIGSIALSLIGVFLVRSYPSIAWGLLAVSAAYIIVGYIGGVFVVLRNRS